LEIIGRFPTETEEDEYEISPSTPVWLSTRDDLSLFTSVMINRLKSMREVIIILKNHIKIALN
jgi:hypothetical protein